MLPFRLIYHEGYDLNFGSHVFPSHKYRLIRERLLAEGVATPEDFLAPEPARDEDVLLVHEPGWVDRLKHGTLSYLEILQLEIPYSQKMVEAFWLSAGGTIEACRRALADGIGFNVGGGFHHALPTHGEGFCAINDIAIAIRVLQNEGAITRAIVVDCDVHQGNGTAAIFAGDERVFTLSIHQFNNFPGIKPPSTVDIHLEDGATDEVYLSKLEPEVLAGLQRFRPELLLYVAGADPYLDDQLGGLSLTLDGLKRRDLVVVGAARRAGVPVAVTLAGGYAAQLLDTVTIHCNTAYACLDALREIPGQ